MKLKQALEKKRFVARPYYADARQNDPRQALFITTHDGLGFDLYHAAYGSHWSELDGREQARYTLEYGRWNEFDDWKPFDEARAEWLIRRAVEKLEAMKSIELLMHVMCEIERDVARKVAQA